MTDTQKMREEFESWAESDGYEIERISDGSYYSHHANLMWASWQAALSAEASAEPVASQHPPEHPNFPCRIVRVVPERQQATDMLVELARRVLRAMDDSEERDGADGREHVLDAQHFDDVCEALDALEELPDGPDAGLVYSGPMKAAALLATPSPALEQREKVELTDVLDCYDAALLSDFGGGNVEWWQDYIRAELARAHDFYQSQMVAQKSGDEDQAAYVDGYRSARFEDLAAFRSLRQILDRKPLDIPGALMIIDSVIAAHEAKQSGGV